MSSKFSKKLENSLFGNYFFIDKKVRPQILRNILINHGIKRLYEIDTSKETYFEIDIEIFNPYEKINKEKFFSSKNMDWVFYANHEDYIQIDGKWLIDDIISIVPEVENMINQYIYK